MGTFYLKFDPSARPSTVRPILDTTPYRRWMRTCGQQKGVTAALLIPWQQPKQQQAGAHP